MNKTRCLARSASSTNLCFQAIDLVLVPGGDLKKIMDLVMVPGGDKKKIMDLVLVVTFKKNIFLVF